ncbi:MAG: glycosyltransferase [Acidobacteria bacterium]|nr:glycosyltransferase [Acidobacteriota bacterium]
MNPLVSILMPCHNAARYVGEAIRSILAQTWRPIELIVVNDRSTDGSADVLDSMRNDTVQVVNGSFGSAAAARNHAFTISRGAYVKFMDADDVLSARAIELQLARLAGSRSALASGEWGRFYGEDASSFRLNPESVWRDMRPAEWLIEAWTNARPMMQPGIFLLPRAIVERSGGWDESLSVLDDLDFFTRCFVQATEVRFAQGACLMYRSGIEGSLSGRKDRGGVVSAFTALMNGTSRLLGCHDDVLARQACANLMQDFIYSHYPDHKDLLALAERRVREWGGSTLSPTGSPAFDLVRSLVGWKVAQRVRNAYRDAGRRIKGERVASSILDMAGGSSTGVARSPSL